MKFAAWICGCVCAGAALASAAVPQLPKFGTAALYTAGQPPFAATVADVNGDGKPDLLVVDGCAPLDGTCVHGSVSVLLGNGAGGFGTAVQYASGGDQPTEIVAADVNHDGKLDLIISHQCLNSGNCTNQNGVIGVLLGNGNGTFRPAVTCDTGAPYAVSVAVADVNGDGKLDLVFSNSNGSFVSTGSVGVMLGNGNGTFKAATHYATATGSPGSVAVGDVNRDGKMDLLVATACEQAACSGGVDVLFGNGDGTFQPAVLRAPVAGGASRVRVANLNRDGKLDVVVSLVQPSSVQLGGVVGVLLGNGDGTFQSLALYGLSGAYNQSDEFAEIADVNGDGIRDLAVTTMCNPNASTCTNDRISVLLGNGNGTFQAGTLFKSGQYGPLSVTLSDLNKDGKLDIVVVNTGYRGPGKVSVRLNTTHRTTQTTLTSSVNPAKINQVVTFTAKVTGLYSGKTTASVNFRQGTTVLGTVPVVAGKAAFQHAFAKAGSFAITAVFLGDGNNLKSTSAVVTEAVTQ